MSDEYTVESIVEGLNVMWIIICGALVFFMQAGFAMLEQGSIQYSAVQNVALKNLIDTCISTFIFLIIGYGIAYGKDVGGFIGSNGNDAYNFWDMDTGSEYVRFFFQSAFAGACTTIVSGGIAGRARFLPYIVYSILISGFIYPIVVHWVWGNGFMTFRNEEAKIPLYDFAGSGVVHMTGGCISLMGSSIIGRRTKNNRKAPQNSYDFICLGTFILWFGWYGFNCGSTLAFGGQMGTAALAAVNTTLSASTGLITSVLTVYVVEEWLSLRDACGGLLGGLVGITANSSIVKPGWACLIGSISGLVYLLADRLVKAAKIDDPVSAFAIHGACGAWGLVATGIFFDRDLIGNDVGRGTQVGYQFLGAIIIAAWSMGTGGFLFLVLNKFGGLRVSFEVENKGMDKVYAERDERKVLFYDPEEKHWSAELSVESSDGLYADDEE